MYTFIPRLPTKQAWDTKPFGSYPTLQAIVEALKEAVAQKKFRKNQIHGEIVYLDDTKMSFFGWLDELEGLLKGLNWQPTGIRQIYLYDLGYFIINSS